MSEPTTLSGPDLAEGIEGATLAEGVPLVGHARGEAVLVLKVKGQVLAVAATCTHYGGPLGEGLVVGETIRCPWHHACFDLRTGAVERPPALNPIACYRVETTGTRIRVGDRLTPPEPVALPAPPAEIVIAGAGAAGHSAAESLRRLGYMGKIALIGRDSDAPYDRPNLSKDYLAGTAPEEWIPLRPREFYDEHKIALSTGVEVTEIDRAGHRVKLSDGRQLSFDRLLLATGADPIPLPVPGADAPSVHMLRTLTDCKNLIAAAGSARRVVIVGTGFIGLEAAAALRARGLEVTVVSPESAPLARVVGDEVGGFLRRLHESHGVTFKLGETVTAVEAGAVVTASGQRLQADLVLIGIGVRPAIALAKNAGISVDGGVLVDEYLETDLPGVFAAGDIARFPYPRSGGRARVEHWAVAQRMGATAAANMLGGRRKFSDAPFFWSVHYDVTLSYVGYVDGPFDVAIDGSLDDRNFRVRYNQGGRRAAVLTVGRDHESLEAERQLETS
jgi:NADPH-dependent 2,4-dienoyl-CoA reductase/sulfur reductase-like enzyme/nitrite reductase/ring-hydroxylating ferredoxin subunit